MGMIRLAEEMVLASGCEEEISALSTRLLIRASQHIPGGNSPVNVYWVAWISPLTPIPDAWNLRLENVFLRAGENRGYIISSSSVAANICSVSLLFCPSALNARDLAVVTCLRAYMDNNSISYNIPCFRVKLVCYVYDDALSLCGISPYDCHWSSPWVSWAIASDQNKSETVESILIRTLRTGSLENLRRLLRGEMGEANQNNVETVLGNIVPALRGSLNCYPYWAFNHRCMDQGLEIMRAGKEALLRTLYSSRPWFDCGVEEAFAEINSIPRGELHISHWHHEGSIINPTIIPLYQACSQERSCFTCSMKLRDLSPEERMQLDNLQEKHRLIQNDRNLMFKDILGMLIPFLHDGCLLNFINGMNILFGPS